MFAIEFAFRRGKRRRRKGKESLLENFGVLFDFKGLKRSVVLIVLEPRRWDLYIPTGMDGVYLLGAPLPYWINTRAFAFFC